MSIVYRTNSHRRQSLAIIMPGSNSRDALDNTTTTTTLAAPAALSNHRENSSGETPVSALLMPGCTCPSCSPPSSNTIWLQGVPGHGDENEYYSKSIISTRLSCDGGDDFSRTYSCSSSCSYMEQRSGSRDVDSKAHDGAAFFPSTPIYYLERRLYDSSAGEDDDDDNEKEPPHVRDARFEADILGRIGFASRLRQTPSFTMSIEPCVEQRRRHFTASWDSVVGGRERPENIVREGQPRSTLKTTPNHKVEMCGPESHWSAKIQQR